MDKTHMIVTVIFALRKVTTSLYMIPEDRTQSLSTLITVNVLKVTAHRMLPVKVAVKSA